VIEINPEQTPLSAFADLTLQMMASEGLAKLIGDRKVYQSLSLLVC
jgi:hypothetical protein